MKKLHIGEVIEDDIDIYWSLPSSIEEEGPKVVFKFPVSAYKYYANSINKQLRENKCMVNQGKIRVGRIIFNSYSRYNHEHNYMCSVILSGDAICDIRRKSELLKVINEARDMLKQEFIIRHEKQKERNIKKEESRAYLKEMRNWFRDQK